MVLFICTTTQNLISPNAVSGVLKCSKIRFQPGFRHGPRWGAHSVPPGLLAALTWLPGARSKISGPSVYKISEQFQDIFVGFMRLKTQKMHIFLSL